MKLSATFRSAVLLIITMLFLCSVPDSGEAAGAMPYSEEALAALNASFERHRLPKELHGDADNQVRTYVTGHKKIFADAGFDYERSINKIINDIQFERYSVNRATLKMNFLARELLRLHVRTGIHPSKYLNEGCAALLIEFRNLIRSNTKKYGGC